MLALQQQQLHLPCHTLALTTLTMSYASDILIWGAQVEVATEASNYQKRVTDIDVTESGVGEVYYLKFDGVSDGYVSHWINVSFYSYHCLVWL